jgi:uncharacterized membrane protein YphA (DoxX/SURF4 family)
MSRVTHRWRPHKPSWTLFWVRLLVGGFFIYSGALKAQEPAEFLKLVRAYELTEVSLVLNMVAATLPWFEIFCGVLLVLGLGVRGTALVLLLLLTPLTALVLHRALELQEAGGLAFCAVRFDCGCGTGEVGICRKLAENGLLMVLGLWLAVGPRSRLALWHRMAGD